MANSQSNDIRATDVTITQLLKDQKYTVDYFQREYRWQTRHMRSLVQDLSEKFLSVYDENHEPEQVAQYNNYYLGPIVLSIDRSTNSRSIVDGQQRITSLTLLLIYLRHQQKDLPEETKVSLDDLIYSVKYRKKSFNLTDAEHESCLQGLYEDGVYNPQPEEPFTVHNMVDRYSDIQTYYPEELTSKALPYFIDWLIERVILVTINAYSDDDAYEIFETSNDRGLSLTASEMLKSFILSQLSADNREKANDDWRELVMELNALDKSADQAFFQALLRGKYASTARQIKGGMQNQDFEQIGSQFHRWFKSAATTLIGLNTPSDFLRYVQADVPFYAKLFIRIRTARNVYNSQDAPLYYIGQWGIADSLQEPLLLSSIKVSDDPNTTTKKLHSVAHFIETYTVLRSLNYKKFGQSSIKHSMFTLIRDIRDLDVDSLEDRLNAEIVGMEQNWNAVTEFRLHGQNKRFVRHLLARITTHVDQLAGRNVNYVTYTGTAGKPYQIEHLLADNHKRHADEYLTIEDFNLARNAIGALILLPQGTNQSLGNAPYVDKLDAYYRENTYAQSLHPNFYASNPNFLKSEALTNCGFQPHSELTKLDIVARTAVVEQLCRAIWGSWDIM